MSTHAIEADQAGRPPQADAPMSKQRTRTFGRRNGRVPDARQQSGDISGAITYVGLSCKRAIDVVGASLALLVLGVPMALIALAVKLSSRGPVLFRQPRYGLGSDLFQILKFRTMYVSTSDQTGVQQTVENDLRVTPLGRFLRRTNLDELPQLINVLRGDMSLVGPRPHVPQMRAGGMLYERLVPYYFERHRMRPGITGLAQVSELRGSTEDARFATARIEYDMAYIEEWSIVLDFLILWTTLLTECRRGSGI
jgi:lipopolysaccharide/colanic/teichoic acid biosynthesis glycosyltransferase